MRRTKDRAWSSFKTIIIIITVPACKSESQHRGSHKKVRYRLNSLCIRSRFPKKSAKVIVCVFLSTAAPFRTGPTWRHDQKCSSQTQALMQRLKFTLAKASLIPKRTFRHPLHHLYSRANFYTSVKWKILFSTFRDKPLKRGRAELPEDVAKLFFFQFVQSYWCPMPSFPVENFYLLFRWPSDQEERQHVLRRRHVKPDKHGFTNCCSCCFTVRRNTLGGKRNLPSSTYTNSEMLSDWQRRRTIPPI